MLGFDRAQVALISRSLVPKTFVAMGAKGPQT